MKEIININSCVTCELYNDMGELKHLAKDHNLILNDGFDLLCDLVGATTQPNRLSHIAIGSNGTASTATMTGLGTEITRGATTYTHTPGTKFLTLTTTFGVGVGTGAIREVGLCNASTGGKFYDRVVFDVINKGDDDVMKVTFQLSFSEDLSE